MVSCCMRMSAIRYNEKYTDLFPAIFVYFHEFWGEISMPNRKESEFTNTEEKSALFIFTSVNK